MKISKLIAELERVKSAEGDLEVTCTHSMIPDQNEKRGLADSFETTIESLQITDSNGFGKHVRVWL